MKDYLKANWPTFRSMLWRLLRGSVATAVAQTILEVCKATTLTFTCVASAWSNPQQALQIVVVSLVTGFILALGVGIRDTWGSARASDGAINKMPF